MFYRISLSPNALAIEILQNVCANLTQTRDFDGTPHWLIKAHTCINLHKHICTNLHESSDLAFFGFRWSERRAASGKAGTANTASDTHALYETNTRTASFNSSAASKKTRWCKIRYYVLCTLTDPMGWWLALCCSRVWSWKRKFVPLCLCLLCRFVKICVWNFGNKKRMTFVCLCQIRTNEHKWILG